MIGAAKRKIPKSFKKVYVNIAGKVTEKFRKDSVKIRTVIGCISSIHAHKIKSKYANTLETRHHWRA